jgi:hypothetical protein
MQETKSGHTKSHAEMKANIEFSTFNGKPIEIVEAFEDLGRVVAKHDKDEPAAVMRNLM